MDRRITDRKFQYKKSFNDPRRKREDMQVQIRKVNRDLTLFNKRVNASTFNQSTEAKIMNESLNFHPDKGFAPPGEEDNFISQASPYSKIDNNTALAQQSIATELSKFPADLPQDLQFWELLVMDVMSSDHKKQYDATMNFRKLLSIEKSPPIQAVINSGVVPRFVEFLKESSRPDLQFEAAWTLTNVASGDTSQTAAVVSENAIPIFVLLISSPRGDVSEQAVWALGNIAGDCAEFRDMVLKQNALNALIDKMSQQSSITFMRNATWAISNLCRGKPPPEFANVSPCLPILKNLLNNTDEEILSDACWALSYLSDGVDQQIQVVMNSEVIPMVIQLLSHHSQLIQTPALRTIGNIVTGSDTQTQNVIEHGAVQKLHELLHSPKRTLRREACWAISNITAGTQDQIQQVINHGLIPPLIDLLSGYEHDIQKEAAWAISNAATGGNALQVDFLVASGCIQPLCGLLKINDTKIIQITLDAIENILKVGVDKANNEQLIVNPYCKYFDANDNIAAIEGLQEYNDSQISSNAWRIIIKYFQYEDEIPGVGNNEVGFDSIEAPRNGFDFSRF